MKKKALALILSTAMVCSLAACGSSETTTEATTETSTATTTETTAATETTTETAAAEETKNIEPCTITFWHAMSNAQEEALISLTDKFNAENEYGITVELVNQGKYSDLSSKIDASVLSDDLPDMAQVYNNWVSDYVDKLVSLDQFITEDYWNDIVPAFAQECESFGDVKVIPFNKSTYVLFYNKTMFDELGIEVPTTWDEVVAAAEVVKAEKDIAFIGFDDMTGAVDSLVLQNGGQYAEAGNLDYESAEATEAIDWLLNLYRNGYATLVGDDQYFSNKISAQNVAAYIGSSTGVTYITADGWDLGVAPVFSGKDSYAYQAGTNLAMFTQDANKQLAVWEYMQFLTSVESTTEWAVSTGYLPVRLSAYDTDEYKAYLAESECAQAAAEQAENYNGVYGGCYKGANAIRSAVSDDFTVFIQDEYTTEDAVAKLMEDVNYELGY